MRPQPHLLWYTQLARVLTPITWMPTRYTVWHPKDASRNVWETRKHDSPDSHFEMKDCGLDNLRAASFTRA